MPISFSLCKQLREHRVLYRNHHQRQEGRKEGRRGGKEGREEGKERKEGREGREGGRKGRKERREEAREGRKEAREGREAREEKEGREGWEGGREEGEEGEEGREEKGERKGMEGGRKGKKRGKEGKKQGKGGKLGKGRAEHLLNKITRSARHLTKFLIMIWKQSIICQKPKKQTSKFPANSKRKDASGEFKMLEFENRGIVVIRQFDLTSESSKSFSLITKLHGIYHAETC